MWHTWPLLIGWLLSHSLWLYFVCELNLCLHAHVFRYVSTANWLAVITWPLWLVFLFEVCLYSHMRIFRYTSTAHCLAVVTWSLYYAVKSSPDVHLSVCQFHLGGPIIAFQVENEFASYSREWDHLLFLEQVSVTVYSLAHCSMCRWMVLIW